jgi:cytochrome c553
LSGVAVIPPGPASSTTGGVTTGAARGATSAAGIAAAAGAAGDHGNAKAKGDEEASNAKSVPQGGRCHGRDSKSVSFFGNCPVLQQLHLFLTE